MRIYKRRVVAENAAQDLASLDERIEHYLDACPPAISGQRGHTALFKVAIILVRGFDLSEEAALPFLRRYNTRCQPPWNEDELKHKLSSAANLQPRGRTDTQAARLSPMTMAKRVTSHGPPARLKV